VTVPGYKSYSRSKPLTIQEFDREKDWWKNRQPSEYAWKVSAQEIAVRNYNLDCKNPHEVALMREYLEIDRQMQAAQNSLKQELMQALGSH
jgi:type I restriction enzyme M protein